MLVGHGTGVVDRQFHCYLVLALAIFHFVGGGYRPSTSVNWWLEFNSDNKLLVRQRHVSIGWHRLMFYLVGRKVCILLIRSQFRSD